MCPLGQLIYFLFQFVLFMNGIRTYHQQSTDTLSKFSQRQTEMSKKVAIFRYCLEFNIISIFILHKIFISVRNSLNHYGDGEVY